ncbi:MAG: class I SAM-dependent methyltransferase [Dyella sp.]|uniref:class I SAM-dependent methyltransferase n=1 Tax=Dyella sp. TaxID=1869338 RepID=UPI003F7FDC1A
MSAVRDWASLFARTPLHPQWLLGRKRIPVGVARASGLLLDIGAADRWIETIFSADVDYVALDYPPTGRDLYGARPHVFADAAHLPFATGHFDAVVCLEVLEHVTDPAVVINEIARVLKNRGRAWISMPFLYPLHDAPFDFQRYTEYGLRRDAERAGLEVVTLRKTGHAIAVGGLLMCLAIAGGVHARRGWVKAVLVLPAILAVFWINVTSWFLSLVWPDWSHMAMGHELEVLKP